MDENSLQSASTKELYKSRKLSLSYLHLYFIQIQVS